MFIQCPQKYVSGKSAGQVLTGIFILLILSFSLTSCQTITKFKCNTKNWTKVGEKDGASGKLADETFMQYYDKCSASGAEIDKSTYLAGYQEGLSTFCTLDSGLAQAQDGYENSNLCTAQFGSAFDDGFTQGLAKLCNALGGQEFGLTGGIYRGTCPTETEQAFLTSYLNAINVSLPQAIAQVTILESKSNSIQSDIRSLELQMSKYDNAIASAEKNNDEVWEKQLESDRSDISSRLSTLRMNQRQTERNLSRARKKTQAMQEMLVKWKLRQDV